MKNLFNENVLEEANKWIKSNQKVVLATVIQTGGSSPLQNFTGSVSGGCVESFVVSESIELIKNNIKFKKLEFKVSNESAWQVGLACGGEISIYIEQIN